MSSDQDHRPEIGRRRIALAGACMAIFAMLWVVIELLGAYAGVPALEVVWFRYATHLLLMLAVLGWRRQIGSVIRTREALRWHVARSLTMLGMPLFFLAGVRHLPFRAVLAVFWLYPVLLLAISFFYARYTPRRQEIVAVAIGYLGVIALLRPGAVAMNWSALLPAGMGLCFAIYLVLTRSLRADSHSVRLFHTAAWVFVVLSLCLPLFWQTPSWRGCAVMGAIGALGWVALYALDIAVDAAPPAAFAGFAFLQPVWSVVLESAVHRSLPTKLQAAGSLLIVVAIGCYLLRVRSKPAGRTVNEQAA